MAIDHLMIKVKDWKKAKAYYEASFKPLGYELLLDGGSWGGFTLPGETRGRIYVKQGETKHLQLVKLTFRRRGEETVFWQERQFH